MRRAVTLLLLLVAASAALAQRPPAFELGFKPDKVFPTGDIDNVNAMNGDVVITIPIGGTYPISQRLSYGLTLAFNSKLWDYHIYDVNDVHVSEARPNLLSNAGLGWRLSLGRLIAPDDHTIGYGPPPDEGFKWVYEGPTGDEHAFNGSLTDTAPVLRLTEKPGDASIRYVDFPNGERHTFQKKQFADVEKWVPISIDDRNGNTITIAIGAPPATTGTWEWKITDSQVPGRTTTIRLEHFGEFSDTYDRGWNVTSVEVPAQNGSTATYQFVYDTFDVDPPSGDQNVGRQTNKIHVHELTRVLLPDDDHTSGSTADNALDAGDPHTDRYAFTYSLGGGYLQQVKKPLGGSIQYEYTGHAMPTKDDNCGSLQAASQTPSVARRTITTPSGSTSTWSYLYSLGPEVSYDKPALGNIKWAPCGYAGGNEQSPIEPHPPYLWTRTSIVAPPTTRANGASVATREDHYFTVFEPFADDRVLYTLGGQTKVSRDALQVPWYGANVTAWYPGDANVKIVTETTIADTNTNVDASEGSASTTASTGESSEALTLHNDPNRRLSTQSWDGCTSSQTGSVRSVTCTDTFDTQFLRLYGTEDALSSVADQICTHARDGGVSASNPDRTWTLTHRKDTGGPAAIYDQNLNFKTEQTWTPNGVQRTVTREFRATSAAPGNAWMPGLVTSETISGIGSGRSRALSYEADPAEGQSQAHAPRLLGEARGSANPLLTWYEYDASGNISKEYLCGGDTKTIDALSAFNDSKAAEQCTYATTFTWSKGVLATATAAGVKTTDLTIDASTGLPTASRDAAGLTTSYAYDTMRRLTSVTPTGRAKTDITYFITSDPPTSALGGLPCARPCALTTQANTLQTFEYDGNGRLIAESHLIPDGTGVRTVTKTTSYDALGRVRNTTDFGGATTTMTYDGRGRTTTVTRPDASVQRTTYGRAGGSGTTSTITQEKGGTTATTSSETYNLLGQLVGVTQGVDKPGNTPPQQKISATYAYDAAGELSTVKINGDQERAFQHDERGLLTSEKHPEAGTTSYKYDAAGLMRRKTDATEANTDYVYDGVQRLRKVCTSTATTPSDCTGPTIKTFTYDNLTKRLSEATRSGTLSDPLNTGAGASWEVKELYEYDGAGVVNQKTTKVSTGGTERQSFIQQYTYDPLGELTGLLYPRRSPNEPIGKVGTLSLGYQQGLLRAVGGYAGHTAASLADLPAGGIVPGITYHDDGLPATVAHTRAADRAALTGPTETITLSATMPRPDTITFGYCEGPQLRADQPSDKTAASTTTGVTLLVDPVSGPGVRYEWHRQVNTSSTIICGNEPTCATEPSTKVERYWVVAYGPDGCPSQSRTATVTPPCPTAYINPGGEPRDARTDENHLSTDLSVSAAGTVQWFLSVDGAPTEAVCALGENPCTVTPEASTDYIAVIKGTNCSIKSRIVHVTVCTTTITDPPPPQDGSAEVPESADWTAGPATVGVKVQGTGPFTFRIVVKDGSNVLRDETSPSTAAGGYSWQLQPPSADSTWTIAITVNGLCASDARTIRLSWTGPVSVRILPERATVKRIGEPVTLRAEVLNGSADRFDWYEGDGKPLGASGNPPPPDPDTMTLAPWPYSSYYVTATIGSRTIRSPRVYVKGLLTCPTPPTIIQPERIIISGGAGTLTASTNWYGMKFQWYRGVLGDTRKPLASDQSAPDKLTAGIGSYWVRATYPCGETLDVGPALISDTTCPAIRIAPPTTPVYETEEGEPVSLSVDATPSDLSTMLQYEWHNIVSSEPQVVVRPRVSTQYWATVKSSCVQSATDSMPVTVHVHSCRDTQFTVPAQRPATVIVPAGTTATLTAAASGSVTYQWYKGAIGDPAAQLLTGQTGPTLIVTSETADYFVRATTTGGCEMDSYSWHVSGCSPAQVATVSPANVNWHELAVFGVNAAGTDLQYQWYQGASGDVTTPLAWDGPVQALTAERTTPYWVRVSNACGSADSPTIWVSVCPTNATATAALTEVMPNTTTQLTAAATSDQLEYAWAKSTDGGSTWAPIAGSTSTVTTPPITGTTQFRATIKSGTCERQTNDVSVATCTSPNIHWLSPNNIAVAPAERITLSVTPDPTATSYTWYAGTPGDLSSMIIAGPSMESTITTNVNQSGTYWVRARRGTTCYSDTAGLVVSVCIATVKQGYPTATRAMIGPGDTLGSTLTIASDTPGVTYEWYTGTNPGTIISNETGATVLVKPTVTTSYWARVKGTCGQPVDSAPITITKCNGAQIGTPTVAPSKQIVVGGSASITIAIAGESPTIQWFVGTTSATGVPISGQTATTLSVSPSNTTTYVARVTEACGNTTDSQPVTIEVSQNPTVTIAQNPTGAIFRGSGVTLTASATNIPGAPAATFAWTDPTTNAVTTGPTYQPTINGTTTFSLKATSGAATTNTTYTVTACALDQNLASPGDRQTYPGQSTTLTAPATPGVSPTYAWYEAPTGGPTTKRAETASSITVAPMSTTQYWATLTAGGCTSTTAKSTVTTCVANIKQGYPIASRTKIGPNDNLGATLTIASDTPGATYQWYTGTNPGTAITNETSTTLTVNPTITTSYYAQVKGSCGQPVNTSPITIIKCTGPQIGTPTVAPSKDLLVGGTARITLPVAGQSPTIQWYIGTSSATGVLMTGQTNTFLDVSPNNTTTYVARVTETCNNSADSTPVTITVAQNPTVSIAQNPAGTVFRGTPTVTLTATATNISGAPAPSYAWSDASGVVSTAASYSIANISATTTYTLKVTSGAGVTTTSTTVNVCPLDQNPTGAGDRQTYPKQSVTLQLPPVSGATPTYAWYEYDPTANVTRQRTETGTGITVAPSSTMQYWATLTAGGCTSTTARSTVNVCIPTQQQPTASPSFLTSAASVTLSVPIEIPGATYQWYSGDPNGASTPITGNGPSTTVSVSATTTFWVRVTGTCGQTANSKVVTVTYCAPATITTQPRNVTLSAKWRPASLSVVATGSGLTYQWYQGPSGNTSTPITAVGSGATTATLSLSSVGATYLYWVRITGTCGNIDSQAAYVSVPPDITRQPVNAYLSYNSHANFFVEASGNYLSYQWAGGAIQGSSAVQSVVSQPITAQSYFYATATSGTATTQSTTATAVLCTGPNANVSVSGSGTYRYLTAAYTMGTRYEWYLGDSGDTSRLIASGVYQAYVNPPVGTTKYWLRIWDADPGYGDPNDGCNCYSDSATITVTR